MTKVELLEEIEGSDGIEINEVNDDHLITYDEYWNREVIFNFSDTLDLKKIIQLNSLESQIDREKLIFLLNKIDKKLFMTISSIFFVDSNRDFEMMEEELTNNTLPYESGVGQFVFHDCSIIVNVRAILSSSYGDDVFSKEEEMSHGILTTILHELWHAHQANPLYENEFESLTPTEKEEQAENFCRREFENLFAQEDYCLF